ncbi:MAG: hypothetical protein SFT92_01955 [Rickettsiales bacterium]|nr:hypothetical protein [Rickettsiales bacterium]
MSAENIPLTGTDHPKVGTCPFARLAGKGQQFKELGEALDFFMTMTDTVDLSPIGSEFRNARSFMRSTHTHVLATGTTEVMHTLHAELRRSGTNLGKLLDEDRLSDELKAHLAELHAKREAYREFVRPYAEQLKAVIPNAKEINIEKDLRRILPKEDYITFVEKRDEFEEQCRVAIKAVVKECQAMKEVPLKLLRRNEVGKVEPIHITIPNSERFQLAERFMILSFMEGVLDQVYTPEAIRNAFVGAFGAGGSSLTEEPLPVMYHVINKALEKAEYSPDECATIRKISRIEPNPVTVAKVMDKQSHLLSVCAYAAEIVIHKRTDAVERKLSAGLKALKTGLAIDSATEIRTNKELAVVCSALMKRVSYPPMAVASAIFDWKTNPEQPVAEMEIDADVQKEILKVTQSLPDPMQEPILKALQLGQWAGRVSTAIRGGGRDDL